MLPINPVYLFLFTLIVNATLGALVTQGPWIINSTSSERVHLKCANWYGAHQELFVVGGLELQSVSNLTDLFKSSGANCVRITYSIEVVKYNPIVKPESIAGILPSDRCRSTQRALDVMDCVVHHLQERGILVIFNNHNSWGGWVGAGAVKNNQGLWNLPGYSTEDWIQSMELLARRYKIQGIDLRNEIHDQDGIRITWGETSDVDTDWLAASTAAYERIHQIDPEILVIVGGLCWNTDLRAMAKNIGPMKAFINRKLIYTVHVYTFSFWWTTGNNMIRDVITPRVLLGSLLCLFIAGLCIYNRFQKKGFVSYSQLELDSSLQSDKTRCYRVGQVIHSFLCASVVFHIGWLCLAMLYYNTATTAGCSSFANDSVWLIILSSVFVLCSCVGMFCFVLDYYLLIMFGMVWTGLLFLSIFVLGLYLSSDLAYSDSLKVWALDYRSVPVWVGEIGTGSPGESAFQWL